MATQALNESATATDHPPEGMTSARERLLACAANAFSQRGYAGTSVAAIALEAEISKSTVFHHFPTKRALYLAVIETAVADFAQTLDSVLDDAGPLDRQLGDYQCQHIAHILENEQVTQLVLRELQKNASKDSAHLVRDVLSGNFQRLVDFISQAQQHGLIRSEVDPSVTALTLISANVFYFQHRKVLRYLPNFSFADQPKRYAQSVSQLIFHGLNGESSQ